jgi:hypothetical protein
VKAEGTMRDTMIDVLNVLAPIAERAVAFKDKVGKPAPPVTKTSIERAEREAKAMTCQCCGRDILAETGVIAHHGYERPGDGYQTASCPGAKELPFEVSRDGLGRHIVAMKASVERNRVYLAKVQAEEVDLTFNYTDRRERKAWERGKEISVQVTRETMADALAQAKSIGWNGTTTFDTLKASKVSKVESEIQADIRYIAEQQARYDGWKQTHERQGDEWVELAA